MSFQDDLMRADAIREIRASGCTLPGVAELIVDFHGAVHVLTNVPKIQTLGEEVAASDSEQGTKMRQLLYVQAKATGTAASEVLMTNKDETKTSTPSESKAAAAASAGASTGSASDAAAAVGASDEATAAAGIPAEPSPGAAPETSVAQGEWQAQGS